jgi:hypothetical protein
MNKSSAAMSKVQLRAATITTTEGKRMGRFRVIEYLSFFAVHDTLTGKERPLGDGVDSLFDHEGTPISPGTLGFCEAWADAVNAHENETLAAYFSGPDDEQIVS